MVKAVLFDLDGTLIDSAPDFTAAVDTVLQAQGYDKAGIDKVRHWVGAGALVLMQRALAHAKGVSVDDLASHEVDEMLAQFMAVYRLGCCHQSRLYDGVLASLATLAERGYRMAMVTNKPVEFANKISTHYGLDAYCKVVFGGDSVAHKKPAPDMLEQAAAALGVAVDDCVMVGDSRADVLSAVALNIPCYAFDYGYNGGQDLAALGATAVLSRFDALLAHLDPKVHT